MVFYFIILKLFLWKIVLNEIFVLKVFWRVISVFVKGVVMFDCVFEVKCMCLFFYIFCCIFFNFD